MKRLLWLDDIRDPTQPIWNNWIATHVGNPLELDIYWLINYDQFTEFIESTGIPDIICFDHDLADEHYDYTVNDNSHGELTGYECAKWLVDFCIDNACQLPEYHIQSSNTVGSLNIRTYLENYKKHVESA